MGPRCSGEPSSGCVSTIRQPTRLQGPLLPRDFRLDTPCSRPGCQPRFRLRLRQYCDPCFVSGYLEGGLVDPAFVFLLASASPSLHSHPPASTRRRSLLIGFEACSSTANLDLRATALIWSIWPCSLKYYRMRSTPFVMVVDKVTRSSWTSTNSTTRHGFSVHS